MAKIILLLPLLLVLACEKKPVQHSTSLPLMNTAHIDSIDYSEWITVTSTPEPSSLRPGPGTPNVPLTIDRSDIYRNVHPLEADHHFPSDYQGKIFIDNAKTVRVDAAETVTLDVSKIGHIELIGGHKVYDSVDHTVDPPKPFYLYRVDKQ